MERFKTPQTWLVLALALMLVGGVLAYLFHTSFGSVTVTRVAFETERGRLAGLLYLPRSADDPRTALVTTTGYLNAREMQAAPAVEMSRRGMVVLALDHYSRDRGHYDLDIDAVLEHRLTLPGRTERRRLVIAAVGFADAIPNPRRYRCIHRTRLPLSRL